HYRGDDGELIAGAGDGFSGIESRREHERAEAGEEAHDNVDAHDDAIDVEPRQARRLGIPADRIDLPAVAHVAQDDVGDESREQEDDDWNGNRSDLALPPPSERRLEARYRAAGGEQKRRT